MTTTSDSDARAMRARYGLDRNPWPRRLIVAAVIGAYLAAAVVSGVALSRDQGIEGTALSWEAGERSVSVVVQLRGVSKGPVVCVVRAQDARSTDIGYGTYVLGAAPSTQVVDLPTLFPASSVAVLGCAPQGEELRVPPPDFPPGVANPA